MKLLETGIVPVYEHNGERAVSARDLHEYLQVGRDFSTWIKEKLEKNGFIEDIDYSPVSGNRSDGMPGKGRTEYALTLDVAKELAMLEGNERGHEVRRYFIEVEKRARQAVSSLAMFEQMLMVAKEQDQRLHQLEATTLAIKETVMVQPEMWRKDILHLFNKAAKAAGGGEQFSILRTHTYDLLEDRAHVDLSVRLTNKRNRAAGQGMPQAKLIEINTLDVIEEDPKLREIYTAIIKELVIKYAA